LFVARGLWVGRFGGWFWLGVLVLFFWEVAGWFFWFFFFLGGVQFFVGGVGWVLVLAVFFLSFFCEAFLWVGVAFFFCFFFFLVLVWFCLGGGPAARASGLIRVLPLSPPLTAGSSTAFAFSLSPWPCEFQSGLAVMSSLPPSSHRRNLQKDPLFSLFFLAGFSSFLSRRPDQRAIPQRPGFSPDYSIVFARHQPPAPSVSFPSYCCLPSVYFTEPARLSREPHAVPPSPDVVRPRRRLPNDQFFSFFARTLKIALIGPPLVTLSQQPRRVPFLAPSGSLCDLHAYYFYFSLLPR